jgi:hypothetical protein
VNPLIRGAIVLPVFGAGFLGIAVLAGVPIAGLRRKMTLG